MLARINRRYVPAYWDDFFNDSFFSRINDAGWENCAPAVNVLEDDRSFRIEMAVPGMSKEDFRINLENDVLTVSSEHKENKEEKNQRYMRREFSFNTFKRSFQLPDNIDTEHIKATQEDGILSVELPKKEEMVQKAPKQIEIN
jgi:HSP20 family protein